MINHVTFSAVRTFSLCLHTSQQTRSMSLKTRFFSAGVNWKRPIFAGFQRVWKQRIIIYPIFWEVHFFLEVYWFLRKSEISLNELLQQVSAHHYNRTDDWDKTSCTIHVWFTSLWSFSYLYLWSGYFFKPKGTTVFTWYLICFYLLSEGNVGGPLAWS